MKNMCVLSEKGCWSQGRGEHSRSGARALRRKGTAPQQARKVVMCSLTPPGCSSMTTDFHSSGTQGHPPVRQVVSRSEAFPQHGL